MLPPTIGKIGLIQDIWENKLKNWSSEPKTIEGLRWLLLETLWILTSAIPLDFEYLLSDLG